MARVLDLMRNGQGGEALSAASALAETHPNNTYALNLYGMAPVIDGLGLLVVVTSYMERLNLSVTASRNLLPNPDPLLGGMRSSYRALHAAARRYLRRRAEGRGQ